MALQLAQAARALAPRDAEVHDTLGWVYYKKELSTFAIQAFRESVELDPTNAVHQFHLGLAYAQEGSDASARKALVEALRLNPEFAGADEARRVVGSLVY